MPKPHRRITEANPYHEPAGSPKGGQFTTKARATSTASDVKTPKSNETPKKEAGDLDPELAEWFGNSKVVDGNGRPLRVYQGRMEDDGEEHASNPDLIDGQWFSASQSHASNFGHVRDVYLKIERPFMLDAEAEKIPLGWNGDFEIAKRFREAGGWSTYDGLILKNWEGGALNYIVHDEDQVWEITKRECVVNGMTRAQLIDALKASKPAWFEGETPRITETATVADLEALLAEARRDAVASLDAQMSAVSQAVRAKFGDVPGESVWVEVTFPDKVVIRKGAKLFALAYTISDSGTVTFTGEPVEVRVVYQPLTTEAVQDEAAGVASPLPTQPGLGYVIGPVRESAQADPTGAEWDVVVIQAGLSLNGILYEPEVLAAAAPKYEGVRVYLDHAEPTRYGRSTRDLAGFLKGVAPIALRESTGATAFALGARLCVTKAAIRDELLEAHRLGKPDLYGLSHTIRAKSTPITLPTGPARRVEAIHKVDSVDLVTTPAAGGRVERLVASAETPASEEDRSMLERLIAKLRAARPDLAEALGPTPTEDQVMEALLQAGSPPPKSAPAPVVQETAPAAPAAVTITEAEVVELKRDGLMLFAESAIAGTSLHDAVKEQLRASILGQITEAVTLAALPSRDAIKAAVKAQVDLFGKLAEANVVLPASGRPTVEVTKDRVEKLHEALDEFFDPEKPARSFRTLYVEGTGDKRISGRIQEATLLREALDSTSFAQVLGDSIARRALAYYRLPDLNTWRRIASVTPVSDFRTQRRTRFGGYGNFPVVAEGGPYTAMTSPGDEEATFTPAKRGGTESVTIEMIRNDDVGAIREIPRRFGRAAGQTLHEFVFDLIKANPNIYDGTALYTVGHANLVTTAISPSNITSLRNKIKAQTDMSSGKKLGLVPRYLWIPQDLEVLAIQILSAAKALTDTTANFPTTAEPAAPNVIQSWRIEPMVVDYWTDANDYHMTASPDQTPMIEVGFLDGSEDPEIFIADNPTVGSMFSNDQLTWKLRHIYGGAVLDYRGFAAGIVA